MEKVYRCDYCNRHLISKGFMIVHERLCKQNPNNKHKCFQYCKHLEKNKVEVFDSEFGGMVFNGEVTFFCKEIGEELYSYKLERWNCDIVRKEGKERMPLQCNSFEIMEGHEDYLNNI